MAGSPGEPVGELPEIVRAGPAADTLRGMRFRLFLSLPLLVASLCGQQLGVIEFPNSGKKAAQEPFLRGVLLLHSFEYDDAAAAFQEAQRADPGFALAYWGEALTHYRPVWGRESPDKGRAALAKGKGAKPADAREGAYLKAARNLFGKGSRLERWRGYSEAMRSLSEAYPEDLEAASLYAVSLFDGTQDRDVRTYMRIASIAEPVFRRNPDHPGALHYLIHAFDDPIHAPLGLTYARRYAKVASAAPHAQHMPSHIFLALGMWDECIASNIDSWNSSEARVKRGGLDSDKRGYHALWWMQYAYLQKGRFKDARSNLAIIEEDARQSGSRHARNHHAYLRAHYLIETERWDADLAPVDDDGLEPRAWGANALAESLREIKAGNLAAARDWLARLQGKAAEHGDRTDSLPIAAKQVEGLLLLADSQADKAVEALREAAQLEERTAFGYGPPFPVKPAVELLAETLLLLDRPREAASAFEASLERTPRRARSLIGLHKAATATGASDRASRAKGELRGYAAGW